MTLKTTQEQTDDLRGLSDRDWYHGRIFDKLSRAIVQDLCHDADRARELEEEAKEHEAKLKEQQAASNNLNERPGNCKQSAKEGWRYAYELEQERKKLNEENANLRAKLVEFSLKEAGELGVEDVQDYLDIERALSGQRLLYNRPLAIRVADLRVKLDLAISAMQSILDWEKKYPTGTTYNCTQSCALEIELTACIERFRALKEQEK